MTDYDPDAVAAPPEMAAGEAAKVIILLEEHPDVALPPSVRDLLQDIIKLKVENAWLHGYSTAMRWAKRRIEELK